MQGKHSESIQDTQAARTAQLNTEERDPELLQVCSMMAWCAECQEGLAEAHSRVSFTVQSFLKIYTFIVFFNHTSYYYVLFKLVPKGVKKEGTFKTKSSCSNLREEAF